MKDLRIARLTPSEAPLLSELLQSEDKDYGKFFIPFAPDTKSVEAMLASVKEDRFWGFRILDELVGFFMLRGFDEGYDRPAFGIYIAKSHANRGLSKVALEYSMCWCRLNRVRALMLKVHSENHFAKRVYEKAGFEFIEVCPRTGHHIMEICWD